MLACIVKLVDTVKLQVLVIAVLLKIIMRRQFSIIQVSCCNWTSPGHVLLLVFMGDY